MKYIFEAEALEMVKNGAKMKELREKFKLNGADNKRLYDRLYREIRRKDKGRDGINLREEVSLEEKGNEKIGISNSRKAKTLEQIFKELEVNRDDYIMERFKFNQWDQSPTFTCRQATVYLKPKKVELCGYPEIKAVRPVYKAPLKAGKAKKGKMKRALIVPDAQIGYSRKDVHGSEFVPYHDFRAMDIIRQVAEDIKPDEIIFLGDMLDLPSFGRYQQKAEFFFTTQPALNTLRLFIDDLLPHTSKLTYIYGNHEARFRNNLIDASIEATQLRKVDFDSEAPFTYSLEYLLGLDEIGVNYMADYPHDSYHLNDNLAFSHSHIAKAGSGATVSKIIQDDPHCSRGIGHIHRCEQATKTTYKQGKPVTNMAFSCGTLARLGKEIPQVGTRQNWQQGFGTVWYEEGEGLFNVNLHHIEQGEAILDGKKYCNKADLSKISKRLGFKVVE